MRSPVGTLARLQAEHNGNTQAGSLLQNQLLAARLREFGDRKAADADANRQMSLIKTTQIKPSQVYCAIHTGKCCN